MKRFNITAIAAAIALAFSSAAMAADNMSKADYKAAQGKIAAEYKSAHATCATFTANAKDVCIAKAKGDEKVAKAELEARNNPNDKTRYAVSLGQGRRPIRVAKEKCDDQKAPTRPPA